MRVAAAVVLLAVNLRTVVASLPPLLPDVRDDLELSATVAGLLTTLPVLLFGVLAPLAPRLARRFGLEAILAGCALLTVAAAAARGIGTTGALFAASLASGVAVAIGQTALPILIRVAFPALTGFLTGVFSMALPLGATLGAGLAVPFSEALGDSWRGSLALWALPAVLATLVWLGIAVRRRATVIAGPPPDPLRGDRLAWAVALYFGLQSAAFYATLAWLPEILEDDGWSAGAAGALLAACALISVVPAFAVPVLAGRRQTQTALMLLIVTVPAIGVLGLLAVGDLAPLWVALIGLGQGGSLGLGLILPLLRTRDAAAVASLTAMTLCVGYIVAAAGPWLLGVAHDVSGGWDVPLAVLLALTVLQVLPGFPACRDRLLGAR